MYVIMSRFHSPLFICIPTPKMVVTTRKKAEEICRKQNSSSKTRNEYYWRKAEFVEGVK